jgi:hypothetical protein
MVCVENVCLHCTEGRAGLPTALGGDSYILPLVTTAV